MKPNEQISQWMDEGKGRPYTSFVYLRNPRTEVKHSAEFLDRYERLGWWAQLKLNGTRSGVYAPPNREMVSWNRHGERHKVWSFNERTSAIFQKLEGEGWFVFDGELMHVKTTHIKHVHYLYDVLVANSVHLTRTTYGDRYRLLKSMFPKRGETLGHYILDDHTWLARVYTSGFRELYEKARENPEVEGLVLKDPNGMYFTWDARSWMIKVRYK